MRIPVASPAYRYLIPLVLLTVITGLKVFSFFYLFLFLTIFITFFYRDPVRKAPIGDDIILAPADGRIMSIEKVCEESFVREETIRIRIFLSIFDVHINRSPFAGTILFQQHIPGSYIAAYREQAPQVNERNLIGFTTAYGKILVVQIAGKVARRIVSWIETGDTIAAGARIGMIKFGSCTEIYLPAGVAINVKEGECVRGGETVLGKFQGESAQTDP